MALWQLSCKKLRKNLGQCGKFSAREIGHGRVHVRPLSRRKQFDERFRALFAGRFGAKMQNGRSLRKAPKFLTSSVGRKRWRLQLNLSQQSKRKVPPSYSPAEENAGSLTAVGMTSVI